MCRLKPLISSNQLADRSFCVKVNDCLSRLVMVKSGVPQGSVLGPTLFNIYVADLVRFCQLPPEVKFTQFADDVKIYVSFDADSSQYSSEVLQNTINRIFLFFSELKLTIAENKTFCMHLGARNPNMFYHINGYLIDSRNLARDLGIRYDNTLSFRPQYEHMIKTANIAMYRIFRLFLSVDPKLMTKMFTTYVRSHLEFGSIHWNPNLKKDSERIEKIQRDFSRILWLKNNPGLNYIDLPSYEYRTNSLKIHSLFVRRMVADVLFVRKVISGSGYTSLGDLFIFRPSNGRTVQFKIQPKLSLVRANSKHQNTFAYRVSRLLEDNDLGSLIRSGRSTIIQHVSTHSGSLASLLD